MKIAHISILSAFVADTYLLASHWVYDEEQLQKLPINWDNLNDAQAMWHEGKKAGDFTHYGDQTLFLLEYLATHSNFDKEEFYHFWSEKMNSYKGYIDGATRNALETMGSQNNDLSICGRFTPLLLVSTTKEEFLENVTALTEITHNTELAKTTTAFFAELLWESRESQNIQESIQKLKSSYPLLTTWIEAGVASKNNDTFTTIRDFGPACGIDGGFAGAIHLLSLEDDFSTTMIKNAKAGGDSSARGMIVTAILATQDDFLMNEKWLKGCNTKAEIEGYLQNAEVIEQFNIFDKDKYSLIISSTSEENEPLTNYAPFVKLNEDYYVSVSSNLPHFTNMLETKKAHILIIEDEASAGHIYARKRLYFSASCELENDSEKIFKLFDARYGDALSFLREMKDFKIIKLTPKERSLVLGFGAAYKMGTDGKLRNKSISHK